MKAVIRRILDKLVNRPRFDDSRLYELYLRIAAPEHSAAKAAEKAFFRKLIEPLGAALIFDIGASGGAKTRIFTALAATVVSVEANPFAVSMLRERFLRNPSVRIVPKACGARQGQLRLCIFGGANEGYSTLSHKWLRELADGGRGQPKLVPVGHHDVEVTTVDQLIDFYGVPSYIKIDVEGFEWDVIQGLTRLVPLISFECNLPIFERETLDIIERRNQIDPTTAYNYVSAEPPCNLESPRWLTPEEMQRVVKAGARTYMEIFCRSERPMS